jgi:hypothetical protein
MCLCRCTNPKIVSYLSATVGQNLYKFVSTH